MNVTEIALTRVGDPPDHLVIESWRVGARREAHRKPLTARQGDSAGVGRIASDARRAVKTAAPCNFPSRAGRSDRVATRMDIDVARLGRSETFACVSGRRSAVYLPGAVTRNPGLLGRDRVEEEVHMLAGELLAVIEKMAGELSGDH